jgi:hypothetical protein
MAGPITRTRRNPPATAMAKAARVFPVQVLGFHHRPNFQSWAFAISTAFD